MGRCILGGQERQFWQPRQQFHDLLSEVDMAFDRQRSRPGFRGFRKTQSWDAWYNAGLRLQCCSMVPLMCFPACSTSNIAAHQRNPHGPHGWQVDQFSAHNAVLTAKCL